MLICGWYNFGQVNLGPLRLVVSVICGVVARSYPAMCLHVSSCRNNCNCLRRRSLWITSLDGSLLWSSYLQFACTVEPYGSLLYSPILSIDRTAFPTPRRKWFMIGIGSGKFLHWSSFSVTLLVGGCLQGWFPLTCCPCNFPAVPGILVGPSPTFHGVSSQAHQLAMSLNIKFMNLNCVF